jgi:agmatine deiminase
MQWPVNRQVYKDAGFLAHVQQTIADIANTIAAFEPVVMLAHADDHPNARRVLSDAVTLWDIPTDDLWCRDAGPLFTKTPRGLAISHIAFNGWGNKQVHARDARIAQAVAARLELPVIPSGLSGENGGVEHDGHGLLVAHESSWVNDNRNPGLSRHQIADRLLNAYGADKIIWSPGVYDLDITDYHIDSLMRFTHAGHALINLPQEPDPYDPFHQAAAQTYDALIAANIAVDVIPEPQTPRIKSADFVASYANYYLCNHAVIAAQFGDTRTDAIAQETLTRHFPDREVIMLNVDTLGALGGGIHCATQQMPAI